MSYPWNQTNPALLVYECIRFAGGSLFRQVQTVESRTMAQSIFAMFDPVDWLLSSLLAAIPATIVDSKSSDSSYVPHERMQLGGSIRFSGTLGCDYMCNRTLQVDIPRNPPETQREREIYFCHHQKLLPRYLIWVQQDCIFISDTSTPNKC